MDQFCSIVKAILLAGLIAAMGLLLCCSRQKKVLTLYVASNGNDTWSGSLPKPNSDHTDGPLLTIVAARDRIRTARQANPHPAPTEVLIREGRYQITAPIVFEPQDSGTGDYPMTYAAYPGEHPRISGGREITGWRKGEGSLWTAEIPAVREGKWYFRQLFVDDQRVPRARTPNRNADPPYLKLTGVNLTNDLRTQTLSLPPGKMKSWQNPPEAEAVVLGNWEITRKLIQKMDVAKGIVTLSPPHLIGHTAIRPRAGMACYIENALELLDQPGEWYLDRRSGMLSYWRPKGQDMTLAQVVAPRLTRLLEVKGKIGQTVHDIHFKGIDFEHTDWLLPAHGYHGQQACFYYPLISPELARAEDLDMRMEFPQIEAAIVWESAESCRLEEGTFSNLGGVGIRLRKGCSNNLIQGNKIFSVAANGVVIGEYLSHVFEKPNGSVSLDEVPRSNRVLNNLIYNCGTDYYGAVGIWAAFTDGTTIAHNLIHDLPYTGISLGFAWNANPTTCKNNRLESNHIHHVMKELADGGGIYTLGLQPGTVLRGNLIHDLYRSPFAFGGAPNDGIFFDEGSKSYLIEDTIIYNTSGEAIRFNRCSHEDHTWKDNHFGMKPDATDFPSKVAAQPGLEPNYRKALSPEP
jgi:glycosyl hydrolase family 141/parallel beta helix pectate lyase-like protein